VIDDGRVLALGVVALGAAIGVVRAAGRQGSGRQGSPVRVGPRLRVPPAEELIFTSVGNHLAALGAIVNRLDESLWDPYQVVAVPSIKEAETRARRDYQAVLGKRFPVHRVTGRLGGTFDDIETWTCEFEGCLVKVIDASDDDIVHQWSSTVRLDPIWPVEFPGELPADRKHLADLEWAYTRGRSYIVVAQTP
jgi:hypothetical protein